ncbi:MAG: phospholipase [Bacteroidetes bacterium]|nr:MAG: phospholipase [Bacteroidota bacterium]
MKSTGNQKVALVLSGGGARGIAHIGVIEELEKRGYEITSIAGTSMGSLIGGVYAAGKMNQLKEWIYTLDKGKVFRLVDFTLSKQGLFKGERVLKKMKDYVPDILIEDLAIPTVLTPVKEENRLLVDGGVLNNIPMAHVQRQEGDMMIAVNVNADIPLVKPEMTEEAVKKQSLYHKKISEFYSHIRRSSSSAEENLGYFSLVTKTLDLMTMRMAEDKIKQFSPEVLISVSRESCNVYDFYKAEEQVEAGRKAAIEVLETIQNREVS